MSLRLAFFVPALLMFELRAFSAEPLKSTEVLINEDRPLLFASGGNSSGIGGDTTDKRYLSAWFYGVDEIKTCYSVAANFGISEAVIVAEIKAAFLRWQAYFDRKKIETTVNPEMINANFSLVGKCVQDEDLKLYFGTGPIFGNLTDLKVAQTLGNPVAYLNKTHLTDKLNWSRGYIRFVSQGFYSLAPAVFPDWTRPGSLGKMITHEIGHVLGFLHVPATIMDADIAEAIFLRSPKANGAQIEIDEARELVSCENCQTELFPADPAKIDSQLADAMGINRDEGISIIWNGPADLSVRNGKKIIPIKIDSTISLGARQVISTNFAGRKSYNQYSGISFGSIPDASAGRLPVVVTRNGGNDEGGGVSDVQLFYQNAFRLLSTFGGTHP